MIGFQHISLVDGVTNAAASGLVNLSLAADGAEFLFEFLELPFALPGYHRWPLLSS